MGRGQQAAVATHLLVYVLQLALRDAHCSPLQRLRQALAQHLDALLQVSVREEGDEARSALGAGAAAPHQAASHTVRCVWEKVVVARGGESWHSTAPGTRGLDGSAQSLDRVQQHRGVLLDLRHEPPAFLRGEAVHARRGRRAATHTSSTGVRCTMANCRRRCVSCRSSSLAAPSLAARRSSGRETSWRAGGRVRAGTWCTAAGAGATHRGHSQLLEQALRDHGRHEGDDGPHKLAEGAPKVCDERRQRAACSRLLVHERGPHAHSAVFSGVHLHAVRLVLVVLVSCSQKRGEGWGHWDEGEPPPPVAAERDHEG